MYKLYFILVLFSVGCGPSLRVPASDVEQGAPGHDGIAGHDGINGHDGTNGMTGALGAKGSTGVTGHAGEVGAAGKSCVVQQQSDGIIITCGTTVGYVHDGKCVEKKKKKD